MKILTTKQTRQMVGNVYSGLADLAKHLQPPAQMTVTEFSEKYISLPADTPVPGAFVAFPYQIEPLNAMGDNSCHTVTLQWAAQVGKSQMFMNTQCYFIAIRPSNMMMVLPTASDVDIMKSTKLDPVLTTTEVVKDSVAKPRGREGKNNNSIVSFIGGAIFFATAGAARTLRSRSVPILILDEISTFEADTGEGSPLLMARNRTKTYGNRKKILQTSTPTVVGDAIDLEFQQGDQRYFHVPCPHCDTEQTLEFKNLHIPKTKDEKTGDILEWHPEQAYYAAECCGATWTDADKIKACNKGRWIATKKFNGHKSYQLNEMYSQLLTWYDTAKSYVDARLSYDLQSFYNNSLGVPWEEEAVKIDSQSLLARSKRFDVESIPAEVVMLTTGTDIQGDRIETTLYGWDRHEGCYAIEHVIFHGDPAQQDVWGQLRVYLSTEYSHATGKLIKSVHNVVDSGYMSPEVYAFCRTVRATSPSKGASSSMKNLYSQSKQGATGAKLINIDTVTAKMVLNRRINITDTNGAPELYFSDTLEEEWFAQLTSEKMVRKIHKGKVSFEFKKMRPRNEALDNWVYAYVAMKIAAPTGMEQRHKGFYRGVEQTAQIDKEIKQEEDEIKNDPFTPLTNTADTTIKRQRKRQRKQRPNSFWK